MNVPNQQPLPKHIQQQLQQLHQQQLQLQQDKQLLQQQLHQIQQQNSTAHISVNVQNPSISTADEIFNDLNFLKFSKLIKEPCNTVMMITFQCLYNWGDACPEKLADHLDEVPVYQTKNLRVHLKGEIEKMNMMRNDKSKMETFDITFYYKLIQFGTNSNEIAAPNDSIWTKVCPPTTSPLLVPLEHLIYLIKKDRNTLFHMDTKVINVLNLTKTQIEDYCDEFLQRLQSIIKQVGARTGVDQAVTDERCNYLETTIKSIRNLDNISSLDKNEVIKCLRERDQLAQMEALDCDFNDDLKSYCPQTFLLKPNDKEIKNCDLLSYDDRVTIISGESGHGKTTLTKYICYQKYRLESKQIAEINNLSTFEFVFRVVCRDITSENVSQFIEGQLPHARKLFPTTSLMRDHLNDVGIMWVIDGRDEATAEFDGFFQSLLKDLPEKHTIIITTRSNCIENLVKKIGNLKVSIMSIKYFVDDQIKDIAGKYLADDVDKLNSFMNFYQNSDNDTKELFKTAINITLCLQLWKLDYTLLKGKLTSHKLFQIIFNKIHDHLVDQLVGRTNIPTKDSIKRRVRKWFDELCKLAFKKQFDGLSDMSIPKLYEEELKEFASDWKLINEDCFSIIFDCEISSTGTKYCFRHNIQIEVLASLYLKRCNENTLKEIAEETSMRDYLMKKKSIQPFDFLLECCDSFEYSIIYSIFLKFHSALQYAEYLLEIKTKKELYFEALLQEISYWDHPLTVVLSKQKDVEALEVVIESLSASVKKIHLLIEIQNHYEIINKILTDYKVQIEFEVTLNIEKDYKFIPIIQIFKDQQNQKLIKKILLLGLDCEETAIEDNSSLENMEEVAFYFDGSDQPHYSKSSLKATMN